MEAIIAQPWETPKTGKLKMPWFVHLLPSLTDFAFILPAFILFSILKGTRVLFADGDTGWQIRTGDWILQHRAVPTIDLFSFSKPHDPWYAWEWGADILLSLAHQVAGLPGVAFGAVILLGLISAVLFRLIRTACGNDFLAFGFAMLAICGSILHWLARPHLFSWLFVLLFSLALLAAERGNRKALVWLPLAMLLWVNLHGGFFIGIALVVTSAVGVVITALVESKSIANAWRSAKPFFLCAVACCAVTFLNPYGWRLHQHVITYLLNAKMLDNIQEYQSLNFRQSGAFFFECMLLLGVAATFWCLRKGRYTPALTMLLWAHLALVSVRNLPIFILLAAPWMASMTQDAIERARSLPWLSKLKPGLLSNLAREFGPLERIERWHLTSALALLFLASAFASGRPGFEGRFSPQTFPVAAIPALRAARPARLFTTDQWADYLLYQYYPSQRVFMDDRSDFYGNDFLTEYGHIISAQHDWEKALQKFSIDAVLVEPDAAIASVLKLSAHWKILADGGSFILFEKTSQMTEKEIVAQPADSAQPVFPQPGATTSRVAHKKILVSRPKINERRS
jgi:hypothetical protein